jgi:membrane-bound metal-dependent hydrolase YbcI (DUF457 family)
VLGHSHALSGLAVGAITLPDAPVSGPLQQVAWVAAWAGCSLLPDLDWVRGSSIAGMWGPLTAVPAVIIGKLARGHRNGTHDLILSPLAFGSLAILAGYAAWSRLLLLALAVGLTLRAITFVLPDHGEGAAFANAVISWGGAYLLITHGLAPTWLPQVVMGGVVLHILGDALTVDGVPFPFTWLFSTSIRVSLGLFKTGSVIEGVLLAPAFLLITLCQLNG